jgi:hypothetical protein
LHPVQLDGVSRLGAVDALDWAISSSATRLLIRDVFGFEDALSGAATLAECFSTYFMCARADEEP